MIKRQYLYDNTVYSVIPCKLSEIPSHIEKVFQYWQDGDLQVDFNRRIKLMEAIVQKNDAYKLIDENNNEKAIFYYMTFLDKGYRRSILLWTERKVFIVMLLLYIGSLGKLKIKYTPHKLGHIFCKFLFTKKSIEEWETSFMPLWGDYDSEEVKEAIRKYYYKKNVKILR